MSYYSFAPVEKKNRLKQEQIQQIDRLKREVQNLTQSTSEDQKLINDLHMSETRFGTIIKDLKTKIAQLEKEKAEQQQNTANAEEETRVVTLKLNQTIEEINRAKSHNIKLNDEITFRTFPRIIFYIRTLFEKYFVGPGMSKKLSSLHCS